MKKGVSETVSFTMIIAISAIISVAIYLWATGAVGVPVVTEQPVAIEAYAYDSQTIRVINLGTTNSSDISALGTSEGDCDFGGIVILEPGMARECTLPAPAAGAVTIYGGAVRSATVYFS